MRIWKAVALCCQLMLGSIAVATEQPARPAEWAQPVGQGNNLFQVAEGLYRSAQPLKGDVEFIKRLGVTAVVSFRAFHDDEKLLGKQGIKLIRVPMNTWDIRDQHLISALRAIRSEMKNGKVLIHCQHGADRTGLVSAMYRIIEQGLSKDAALKELVEGGYGYHTMWQNIPRIIERTDVVALKQQL